MTCGGCSKEVAGKLSILVPIITSGRFPTIKKMLYRVSHGASSTLRNHASSRSLLCSRNRYSTKSPVTPLKILYCGSDEFSNAALRALHAEHVRDPSSIASIDVLCRPGKPSGRGMKHIRDGMHPWPRSCLRMLIFV